MTVQRTPTVIAMEAAFMIGMINSMPVPEPLPDDDDEPVQQYRIVLLGWDDDDFALPTLYDSYAEAKDVVDNDEFMVNAIIEPVPKRETYIIKGHDSIFGHEYTDDREFDSFNAAHERCRHNEWVEKVVE